MRIVQDRYPGEQAGSYTVVAGDQILMLGWLSGREDEKHCMIAVATVHEHTTFSDEFNVLVYSKHTSVTTIPVPFPLFAKGMYMHTDQWISGT